MPAESRRARISRTSAAVITGTALHSAILRRWTRLRPPEEYSMDRDNLPEHVQNNRLAWDRFAADYVGPGEASWAAAEPSWGIFGIPESEVHLLSDDLTGLETVELGCRTAYGS